MLLVAPTNAMPPSNVSEQIGQRIRSSREAMRPKLSRREMADRLDVAISTVQNWEEGSNPPPADQLLQIADMLCVSSDFLLGREPALSPGKMLLDTQLVEAVEKAIAERDEDLARQLVNWDDPALLALDIILPSSSSIVDPTIGKRTVTELTTRFREAFPGLCREWSRARGME